MPSTTLRARLRAGALLVGATASLGLAACGGDDDGGGSSKEDYQSSLNTFCGNLTAKQKSLEADVDKATGGSGGPAEQATAMARFLSEYGTTLTSELDELHETGVPGEYEQFDKDLSAGIAKMAQISTSTAEQIRKVDLSGAQSGDTKGLDELQKALSGLSEQENPLKDLKAPADLEKATPNCADLSS